jgi:hypothetical protein
MMLALARYLSGTAPNGEGDGDGCDTSGRGGELEGVRVTSADDPNLPWFAAIDRGLVWLAWTSALFCPQHGIVLLLQLKSLKYHGIAPDSIEQTRPA